MPDEFELPETPENPESHKERIVGLIIAAVAVVLAIVTHVGNETNNEKILAHVDASDQFAFYQAKKERRSQLELQTENLHLQMDRLSPASQTEAAQLMTSYAADIKRLGDEGKEIQEKGNDLLKESVKLSRQAMYIETGEILLQIAIVVSSITILTEQRLFVLLGVGSAILGVMFALWGAFLR